MNPTVPVTAYAALRVLATSIGASRALVAFDLETTSAQPDTARIVSFAGVRYDMRTDERVALVQLVDPGCPIPAEAAAVHGITDAMVAGQPRFSQVAGSVEALLADADVVAYNGRRFDATLIAAEFRRLGTNDPLAGARVLDPYIIFTKREPRTLAGARQFFCGMTHDDAHDALADVIATLDVFIAQLDRYSDLPRDVAALDAYCDTRDPNRLDPDGKLAWRADGEVIITFGKNTGRTLRELAARDPGFLQWVLGKDFSPAVKGVVRDALNGRFPLRPQAA